MGGALAPSRRASLDLPSCRFDRPGGSLLAVSRLLEELADWEMDPRQPLSLPEPLAGRQGAEALRRLLAWLPEGSPRSREVFPESATVRAPAGDSSRPADGRESDVVCGRSWWRRADRRVLADWPGIALSWSRSAEPWHAAPVNGQVDVSAHGRTG